MYETKAEIIARAAQAIGLEFKAIDKTGRLATGKGSIGNVIEESWFGIRPNSRAEPDFAKAGVELKVTPFRNEKSHFAAKERLVLNIINYMDECSQNFFSSSFWHKNQSIEMMFYEYIKDKPISEFSIAKAILFEWPEQDLEIVKRDWEKISSMIKTGRAHEITEGMTEYLAACTKGKDSSSTRQQPFSTEPAKQRAYSLKSSYMTYLLNNYVFGNKTNEKIIQNPLILKEMSFEEYVDMRIKPYLGATQESLIQLFGIKTSPKNVNEMIVSRMFNVKGKISNSEEFQKAGITVRTVRVEKSGVQIRENVPFSAFSFKKVANEQWDSSDLRDELDSSRYLFIVFQFNEGHELIFRGVKFWNMPIEDLDGEVKKVWESTAKILKEGVELIPSRGRIENNLPKQSESTILHVRPHTAKSSYEPYNPNADELPDGRWMTKQSFWLNNSYVMKQLIEVTEKPKVT